MARKDKSKPAAANSAPATADEPVFSNDALRKLQQKIQDGMSKVKLDTSTPTKKKFEKGDKKKSAAPETKKPPTPHPKKFQDNNKNKPAPTQQSEPRGKKRTRDADKQTTTTPHEKPQQQQSNGANGTAPTSNQKPAKGKNGKKSVSDEVLLKEILEMGGTAEDLELIKGIDSDSEEEQIVEGTKGGNAKGLRSDIEKLMAEMGYNAKKFEKEAIVDEAEVESGDDEEGSGFEDVSEDDEEEDEEQEDDGVEEEDVANTDPSRTHTKGKLLFPPRPDWHAFPLPPLSTSAPRPPVREVQNLKDRGDVLLKEENSLYSTTHLVKSSDRQFLSTIMTSGTLSDKVSALTLICQESPLHTTKTLETLLALSKKKSRSQAIAAIAAIKDLLASGMVLPSDRKLVAFAKQPGLGSKGVTDQHLLVWAFEDWLKNFYFEVLKVLEGLCADQLEFARSHAVGYVYELLKEKPEQESNLLRMLVNKLGDKEKKVSSKVSFLLLQLQQTHPAMKKIIIDAIESEVLFRPGNSPHAKYYAIITLNQTIISVKDVEVANKLIDLYFAVFTSLLSGQPGSRDQAKAAPVHEVAGKPEAAPKGGRGPPPKRSKKAKKRLEEAERQSHAQEELNAKLISAVLTGVNRAFPFSKIDDDLFQKHIDTLFRITHSGNLNTSIQALLLIFQVSSAKQVVSDRFYRTLYESLFDQRLITSSKHSMYLNLLFRALKADNNLKRVKAFVKRIVQVSSLHQPAFICGVFYLLAELETVIPSIRTMLDTPEAGEDDDEEVFRDAPDEDDNDDVEKQKRAAAEATKLAAQLAAKKLSTAYDGRKRDPEYANADQSCLWEILPFLNHFHPSVALYASCFLYKRPMPSKPDLGLHTLTHFLDRFVFRNPTTRQTTRGHSIMQPLPGAGSETKGMVLAIRGTGKAQAPVNSEAFWRKKVEDVAVDEVFFHKYFAARGTAAAKEKKKRGKKGDSSDDEDAEGEGSEAGEGEIWDALVKSRPELEIDEDDEDVDMDDFESLGSDESDSSDEEEGEGKKDDEEEDSEDEEEGGITLDSAIADSLRTKKGEYDDVDEEQNDEDSDDDAALALDSEGSDVWGSDDEVDMDDLDAAFAAELETGSGAPVVEESSSKKGKKGKAGKKEAAAAPAAKDDDEEEDGKKAKKRKLKHLPTFASADDYAHLLRD